MRLFPVLFLTLAALAAEKPVNHGKVGAHEGPVWDGKGSVYFTGSGKIRRFEPGETVSTVREGGAPNGLLFDQEGRLVFCDAGRRAVIRLEKDGTETVLAGSYEGMRFNSPNDLDMDSRGRIYFSDPRYGPREGMEMKTKDGRTVEGVYRIDAPGSVTRVLGPEEVERPNGVLVTPDGKYLYVADNNNSPGGARKLWRFNRKPDGSVAPESKKLIFDWGTGRGPDGLEMDAKGRIYAAGGRTKPRPPAETAGPFPGAVYVIDPAKGELIERIEIPTDEVTNCTFGGSDGRTLYITAGEHLWSVRVPYPGRAFAR